MNGGALALPPSAVQAARCAQTRRWPSRLATGLLAAAAVLAVGVGVAASLGYRTEVILTGSMRPTLSPNDMVVVHGIRADEMRVGDIVSFQAPGQHGVVITHRVRRLSRKPDGRIAVVTRGDANNTSEHWAIAPRGSVARVIATLPQIGSVTDWAGNPILRLLVIGGFGMAITFFGLRWVWTRP